MHCKLAQADLSGRSVVCFRTLIYLGDPLISRISFDGNVSFKSKRTAHTELPPLPASITPSADPPSSSTQAQYFVLIMYFVLIIPENIEVSITRNNVQIFLDGLHKTRECIAVIK